MPQGIVVINHKSWGAKTWNSQQEVLPQARIVGDRFHVARLYRVGLDELRKQEMKDLRAVLTKDQYAGLKGAMWALRRNRIDLKPEGEQVLDLLFECSPALRSAYETNATDLFRRIWLDLNGYEAFA